MRKFHHSNLNVEKRQNIIYYMFFLVSPFAIKFERNNVLKIEHHQNLDAEWKVES